MKRINYISYLCLFYFYIAALFSAEAQTYYTIPDDSLYKALMKNYDTLFNANGQLIVAKARGMSADLNLDNAGITNADGIQFFESTGILRLRNNKLTSIPQLSSMKGLRRIYINGNQITSIPDLTALYKLADLYIVNNKIVSLAGSNIETKTTLLYLTCSGNNITTLPDLSQLTNLKTLSVDHNPLTSLPDLKFNTGLQQLDVGNTDIHIIPSLDSLINLERFNCDNSNMTKLSGLDSNTKLIKISAKNCQLTSLPFFGNKPNLISATIENNYLTFEDLIPLTSLNTFSVFAYSPQKEVSLPLYATIRETNNFTYQVSIDPALTTNKYTWHKNGIQVLIDSPQNYYTFAPVFMGDSGTYYTTITNPALTGLTLRTNYSKLTVRPCIEINTINLSVLSSDCREGSLIDIAGTTIDGGTAPVSYTLQSTSPVSNIPGSTDTQFKNIIPGTYILTVTDSKNCSAMKPFLLDKGVDCESVFSPNGDGIMDNYFIPNTGTIQIYNSSKKLIRTMSVPAAWDGTTNDGSLADAGYYVIVINGSSSFGVSLMR
ncbi:leucine-rich repeat domain-containing protein [Cytophaga aurantiaca]|uniref:leucine-rich repeat domain-containing protein n=1 Tax=Cytophaga aurantiaca TaxID=29530 RepID=UPI00036FA95F|nr:leucine-rich repeat domain-containing protein [Cytophaga aurantiaca]